MKAQDLRKVGLRATMPRLNVLQALEGSQKRHLSAEDIHEILRQDGVEMGYATIYRILTQFTQVGIAIRHVFDNGPALYELADSEHHDHMYCVETDQLIEFTNEEIERLQEMVAREHGYELVDHSLVLYVRPLRKGKG